MTFELSCAFATSMATPDHVAAAESLGYKRAWLYDSPALYPDVWVMLARCADRAQPGGTGPREVEQVLAFGAVQPQDAGDGLQHRVRDAVSTSLFEADVVVRADAGELISQEEARQRMAKWLHWCVT